MPCNCDHMEPNYRELEISKIACLLDELEGKKIQKIHWEGYHPRIYNSSTQFDGDKLISELCDKLKTVDVKDYSLEMQMWWRDHQIIDNKRIEKELNFVI